MTQPEGDEPERVNSLSQLGRSGPSQPGQTLPRQPDPAISGSNPTP